MKSAAPRLSLRVFRLALAAAVTLAAVRVAALDAPVTLPPPATAPALKPSIRGPVPGEDHPLAPGGDSAAPDPTRTPPAQPVTPFDAGATAPLTPSVITPDDAVLNQSTPALRARTGTDAAPTATSILNPSINAPGTRYVTDSPGFAYAPGGMVSAYAPPLLDVPPSPPLLAKFMGAAKPPGAPVPMHGALLPPTAEEYLDGSGANTFHLSLRTCIRTALEANLDIAVEQLNPVIARADTLTQFGAFDPTFSLDVLYGRTANPTFVVPRPGIEELGSYDTAYGVVDARLTKKFATGTQFTILSTTRNDVTEILGQNYNLPQYSSFAGVDLRQPLLRDFGTDVNLAPIRIARRGEQGADANFQFIVEQVVTNVAFNYYELIYLRQDYFARAEALALAEQLLRDNQSRVDMGTMSPLDVSQARSEVASRRQELIAGRRLVLDQENVLKRLFTRDVRPWLSTRLLPTDKARTDFDVGSVGKLIETGLANRADYKQEQSRLEQAGLLVHYNRNQLLPQLDARGQYGYAGLSRSLDGALGGVGDAQDAQWFTGLTLTIPIGNSTERGRFNASQAREAQNILTLRRLEQDIIVQIDNAAGRVVTDTERVAAGKVARELAEETLAAEEEKLASGITTSYIVLQLQRDLTTARVRELRAVADVQRSAADLLRVQGIALKNNGIEIIPSPSPKDMDARASAQDSEVSSAPQVVIPPPASEKTATKTGATRRGDAGSAPAPRKSSRSSSVPQR